MTETPLVRVEGLKKQFTEDSSFLRRLRPDQELSYIRAVDGVDLTIRRGEFFGLVGESGCGKSTLARSILRLIEPSEGRIQYGGGDITEFSATELRQFRRNAQMIHQDPFSSLNPRYRVRKTLIEPMEIHGIGNSREERIERALDLLEQVNLSQDQFDRYPHELSGGQRQRVSIARALAVEPDLLVADEPTSALDVSVQAEILGLLKRLQRDMGLSFLFITHDLSVLRQVADRVAVMYLGEIVELQQTESIFQDPKHPYTQSLVSSIPIPDPGVDRNRIPLEGTVPSPSNPPSGCRFHTRCPKVIPSDKWEHEPELWRRIFRFKTWIDDGTIQPKAIKKELESETDANVTDEAIEERIFEEYVASQVNTTLPETTEELVSDAIHQIVIGNRSEAIAILDEPFSSICTEDPATTSLGESGFVKCHLYGPEDEGGSVDSETTVKNS